MKFSQVSADSRLRQSGRLRNANGNQEDLKRRLKQIASKGIMGSKSRPKIDRFADQPSKLVPSGKETSVFARLVEYKKNSNAEFGSEINTHPMWYHGADSSMFAAVHVDSKGRSWSHADAAYIMQPVIKGFLHRKTKKVDAEAALSVLKQIYAKKLQSWWRGICARVARRRLQFERTVTATAIMQALIRTKMQRHKYENFLKERISAAKTIQLCFRKNRMLRLIPVLKQSRLRKASTLIQCSFRRHLAKLKFIAEKQDKVRKHAKALRDEYLFAAKNKEDTNNLRKDHAAKPEGVDVQELSKNDFWNLDAKAKDSNEVAMKLEECRHLRLSTLDLSQQTGGLRETLKRWPYGLQGKHGLFHLTALGIQGNQIQGLPLDFYYLTSLTEVRANNNRIKGLLPEIKRLQELQNFWMHQNCLTSVPPEIGSLTKLAQLSLADNQIHVLPGEIGFLTSLTGLKIDGNPWQSPPTEIVKTLRPREGYQELGRIMHYLRKYANASKNGLVELDGHGLLRIPESFCHFKAIVEMHLQNNRINKIEDWLFGIVNLVVFKLDVNRIEKVPRAIRKLKHLTDLGLSTNRIEQGGIPIDSLIEMTTLQHLTLSGNFLSSPPPEILIQPAPRILDYMRVVKVSQKISVLDASSFKLRTFPLIDVHSAIRQAIFDDNMFREIPSSLFGVVKLKELHFSKNLIHTLPVGLASLTRLTILNVSVNNITTMPDYLGSFVQLAELNFSQNQLQEIPACVGNLTNLRYLSVTHNRIRSISRKLNLLQLWELNLSYNCIQELPDAFKKMGDLRKLILEGNSVSALPNTIVNCVNLEILNVSKNPLAEMPATFSCFGNVQLLQLSDCKLTAMPNSMTAGISIQNVQLERNQIDSFPTGLCTLKSVQNLYLKQNFMTELPPETGQLLSLSFLDMSHNQLCIIAAEIKYLSNLTHLDLSSNKIRALPPLPMQVGPVFGLMHSLQLIDLRHNLLRSLPDDLCLLQDLKELCLEDNPWTGNPTLKQVIRSSSADLCGELEVHVIQAHGLARMDAGEAISDPYIVVELGKQKLKSQVKPGTLNPKWDETLSFQLWGHPDEDMLKFSVWDWDLHGAHDLMGAFDFSISPDVLQKSTIDDSNTSEYASLQILQGEDALGRKARGKIEFGLKFFALDGSLQSILRYLNSLRHSGRAPTSEVQDGTREIFLRPKAKPYPLDFSEVEEDEIRNEAEVDRMDAAVKQVREWLWRAGAKKEPWETLDIFYTPSGVVNCPWEMAPERYERQFDAMQEYLLPQLAAHHQEAQILGGKPRRMEKLITSESKRSWKSGDVKDTEQELLYLLKDEMDMEY